MPLEVTCEGCGDHPAIGVYDTDMGPWAMCDYCVKTSQSHGLRVELIAPVLRGPDA